MSAWEDQKKYITSKWQQQKADVDKFNDQVDKDLENELNKYKIDYYFFWGETKDIPQFLTYHKEITGGEIPGLRIFSLKDKTDH